MRRCRYSSNKDIARIVNQLIQKGWSFQKGRRHNSVVSPDSEKLTVPNSPSDRRAVSNFKCDIQRKTRQGKSYENRR